MQRQYNKSFVIVKKCDIMKHVRQYRIDFESGYKQALEDKLTDLNIDINSVKIVKRIENATTFHVYIKLDI